MAKERLKSFITSFTPEGDYLAILSAAGTVKVWNTSNGSLLAEWNQSDFDPVVSYTCMACSFVGKKRRKGRGICLLALGKSNGDILAVDAFSGESKWELTGCYPGGVAGLSFTKKGHRLQIVGTNGVASERSSETGELVGEFKASKRPISSVAFSPDAKILALACGKVRIVSLETGKELLKFTDDMGPLSNISLSDDATTVVTSKLGKKQLHVWRCDLTSKTVSNGPVLHMRSPPLSFECKSCNEEGGAVILAVTDGVAYLWNLKTISQDEVHPTKVTVKENDVETNQRNISSVKEGRTSVIAAKLCTPGANEQETAILTYGSIDSPQFSLVDISVAGEKIVINVGARTNSDQETGTLSDLHKSEKEATVASKQSKKTKRKQEESDAELATTINGLDTGHEEGRDGVLDNDVNEPTMGEKLANLNLLDDGKAQSHENQGTPPTEKPPSADSVNVLLKQALHADDRALLLECLYNQNEKVIANSVSRLNPSDVLKLLHSLVSIILSRGAVLVCVLPWLKSLLLHHASGIMSQESSMLALNRLYQLIESRVATFQSTLQLASSLDFLYAGDLDDGFEEDGKPIPVIYEDKDESEEEESEDAMEADQDGDEEEVLDGLIDIAGNDSMSE